MTLLIGALLGLCVDVLLNGFALSGACDPGFGARHSRLQEQLLRNMFSEPLPAVLDIEAFTCDGFQDLSVTARFRIKTPEGDALIAALAKTFDAKQNHKLVPDADKKRHVLTMPTVIKTTFYLPGVTLVYGREIVVTIPNDTSVKATVDFAGWQW